MRKTSLAMFALLMMFLISTSFSIKSVKAASSSTEYGIEHVDHKIEVMYNGYLFINDTIKIVGRASDTNAILDSFLIGFPYKYGSHVLRYTAYDTEEAFQMKTNVPLLNHTGFYAAEIVFPEPLNASDGVEHVFNVGFILSNDLLSVSLIGNVTNYTLDFPAYPSFTKIVDACNGSIIVPEDATYISGTMDGLNYSRTDLPELTYLPANVTFSLATQEIQKIDVNELKREISVNGFGHVEGLDTYYLTNKATTLDFVDVILPSNTFNHTVKDQFGRNMKEPTLVDEAANLYMVAFKSPLETGNSTRFTIKYNLPAKDYMQQENQNLVLDFPLFQNMKWYVKQASVTFVLPEGARISTFESPLSPDSFTISRGIFQETATINKQDVFYMDSFNFRLIYEYNPIWLAFRPSLWIFSLSIVGCIVAVIWRKRKPSVSISVPIVTTRLRSEDVKSFVDAYEEKNKILLELESLEAKVRKGKIPRRRYKVQKVTSETRLTTLNRNLAELKEKMRAAGGQFVDFMRQLEIAETEINEVEANIKSIESRHGRGEISFESHRKLLSDYQRRKEKADTSINGILLRLREEIH